MSLDLISLMRLTGRNLASLIPHIKRTNKLWGYELLLIDEPEYCLKVLYLEKGAYSSLHYHRFKKETLFSMTGKILLEVEGKQFQLRDISKPVTILPNQKHKFTGLQDSLIVEMSTQRDDTDTKRTTLSGKNLKT